MANEEHRGLIKQGADVWNKWRKEHEDTRPDLRHAGLTGARLIGANLSGADLSGAYLVKANLSRTNLTEANLSKANLRSATFSDANLSGANLAGANLRNAKLFEANLTNADLEEADVIGAEFPQANLSGVNLVAANLGATNLSRANLTKANLRWTNLYGADLTDADLSGANLSGADLTRASLVETNLENANLVGCRIYGISAWNVRVNQGTKQYDLIITQPDEATVKVDDIQVAQFIYLILNYENLRNVLNSVTKRGVLILGRFGGGGVEVLRELGEALRQFGYLPMIFEFERPEDRNYTETVRTLAGLARFVVADLSGPSVPQELSATVPHLKIPFVPIIEKGRRPNSMIPDLLEFPWVLKRIVKFDTTKALIQQLQDKIVTPAEKRIKTRQAKLKELFD